MAHRSAIEIMPLVIVLNYPGQLMGEETFVCLFDNLAKIMTFLTVCGQLLSLDGVLTLNDMFTGSAVLHFESIYLPGLPFADILK